MECRLMSEWVSLLEGECDGAIENSSRLVSV